MTENDSFLKRTAHSFVDFIKSKDAYGVPVGLTIKGESEYKTFYGGLISLALNIYFF